MALYPLDLYRRAEAKCMRERLGKFALTRVHSRPKTPSPRAPARLHAPSPPPKRLVALLKELTKRSRRGCLSLLRPATAFVGKPSTTMKCKIRIWMKLWAKHELLQLRPRRRRRIGRHGCSEGSQPKVWGARMLHSPRTRFV